ncbi:MAG: hypothetical protein ABSG15_10050, partial [FCB group bacterium]
MKFILRILIISIMLFCFYQGRMMCFQPNADGGIAAHSKHGDHSLNSGWSQEFLEEAFYQHFDYFKVWMKTVQNGDQNENDNQTGEYPNTNCAFDVTPFSDAGSLGWTTLGVSDTMFEAYAPSSYNSSSDFYFYLNFKNQVSGSKIVTCYFAAYDTRSIPGTKILVNFCAIYFDGSGWHCNNFDRPVNVYVDPKTENSTLFTVIQKWHLDMKINGSDYGALPAPGAQISYWPFDECYGDM